jgi:hypothetical protein
VVPFLTLAACYAAPSGDCPVGAHGADRLCVPDRLDDPCDRDRDGFRAAECGGSDCDDGNPSVRPRADEACNGRDDDCDTATDEGLSLDWYRDADGDGWGDAASGSRACAAPDGHVERAGDCDDSADAVRPGGTETCDGRDEDCDGFTDEGVTSRWYRDADGDGYGAPGDFIDGCTAPAGYVDRTFDCDDGDDRARPGQTQYFEEQRESGGWDYDCDGEVGLEQPAVLYDCSACTGALSGWASEPVPACGETAELVSCLWAAAGGCYESWRGEWTQSCR